jgi:hypothetical protein
MHTHPNVRLTPLGRERLLRRHIEHCESLASLADQAGISVRSAYMWLAVESHHVDQQSSS